MFADLVVWHLPKKSGACIPRFDSRVCRSRGSGCATTGWNRRILAGLRVLADIQKRGL